MHFTTTTTTHLCLAAAIATLTSLVHAQNPFSFNTVPSVTAGVPFQITWSPSTGTQDTITLLLKQGPPATLATVLTIASHVTNVGSYAWAVPATLVKGGNYSFEIVDDGNEAIVNYSIQFSIDSKVLASSGAVSASATASGTASATAAGVSTTGTAAAAATAKSGAGTGRMASSFGLGFIVILGAVGVVLV